MKNILLIIISLCFSLPGFAQKTGELRVPQQGLPSVTVINKVPKKNTAGVILGYNHVIQRLSNHLNDGKYDRAKKQVDIIGNDFNSSPRIYAENSNDDNSGTSTDLVPVDGFKRTFCGKLHLYEYHDGMIDQDLNVYLELDPNNPLLLANQHKYEHLRDNVAEFFDPWNIIEGEVHIRPFNRDNYANPATTLESETCIYGSWVFEVYKKEGVINAYHKNNNEIHPIDQFWFRDRPIQAGNLSYKLHFFVDGSGKFDKRTDYYNFPSNATLFKPWSSAPNDGRFYMAFQLDLKRKQRLTYWIEVQSDRGAQAMVDDGANSYLLFGRDTLISIHEGSQGKIVNAEFLNVGYSPIANGKFDSTMIQGFLVLSSKIKGVGGEIDRQWPVPNDYVTDGDLRLRVERKSTFQVKQSVSIEITSIRRLENNSFRYIDAQTNTVHTDPSSVPPGYNEKSVFVSVGSGNNYGQQEILALNKGEQAALSGVKSVWTGLLSDTYKFELFCKENFTGNDLGKIVFTGDPASNRNGIEETVLLYSTDQSSSTLINDSGQPPNIQRRVKLFAVSYRIISTPMFLDRGQGQR